MDKTAFMADSNWESIDFRLTSKSSPIVQLVDDHGTGKFQVLIRDHYSEQHFDGIEKAKEWAFAECERIKGELYTKMGDAEML